MLINYLAQIVCKRSVPVHRILIFTLSHLSELQPICLSFFMVTSHCPPPDTHSRVILKSQDEDDFLATYINANYLKVSENVCVCKLLPQLSFVM